MLWPVELEFLAACARSTITDAAEERIVDLAEQVEWSDVVRLGGFHRVLQLFYQTVKQLCPERIPDDAQAFLHRKYVAAAAFNLRLADELLSIRSMLSTAGADTVYFKGTVLAQFAYRNLGLRPCTDVDVLIREADLFVVDRLLRESGYQPAKSLTDEGNVDPRKVRITGQCPYVRLGSPWSIDVHTALMPPGYSYPMSFDTLYERSVRVVLNGEEVPTFCAEDLLQILCLHGVKNRWEALKHVCDVAELVRSQPDLDWDEVIRTARSIRGERVLYVGLELARSLLDLPLPEEVRNRMSRDARVRELAGQMEDNLAHSHERSMADRERLQFHLKIQDSLLNKARYGLFVVRRRIKDI